jgi:DNA polymerase III delta prime subunit
MEIKEKQMKIKYKPVIRKEGIEELVSAELISGELCVTVLKSWPTFAEAKAHEGDEYIERETTVTEEEAKAWIKQKETDVEKAAAEAEKQEALDYLKETDYVVIKIAEGISDKSHYKKVLKKRSEMRAILK